MSGLAASGQGKSEPLSITPFVGVEAEYSSNPFLLTQPRGLSDTAILVTAPINYDLDAAHFALNPNVRYSDSGTYASLQSNSLHLDGSVRYLGDLGSFSVTGGFGRDSSLYYSGLTSDGVGVRADSKTAGAAWQRSFAPRLSFELDSSWQQTAYGDQRRSGLQDYDNVGFAPSLQYLLNERDTVSVLTNGDVYKTANGLTESKSVNLQAALDHRLTEIWTLSVSGGYSVARNSFNLFFRSLLIEKIHSDQKSLVYKATLTRKGELFDLTASASRAFVPTGFAYLSRQDSASIASHYTWSERWGFAASGTYQRTQDPFAGGETTSRSYFAADLQAKWNWTENWAVALEVKETRADYQVPHVSTPSTTVSLEISRQFPRMDL
jgi:hypothetical protein